MTTESNVDARSALEPLTLAVAYAVDNHPQCFLGTAMLVELARLQGFELEPVAVSMAAQRRSTGAVVVTGHLAHDYFVKATGATVEPTMVGEPLNGSEFDNAGHIVAIDWERNLLLDPTFGQFTKAGMPDLVPVIGIDPGETEWLYPSPDDVNILYIHDASNGGWRESYDAASPTIRSVAASIAAHLDAGGAPHTHGHVFDPGSD